MSDPLASVSMLVGVGVPAQHRADLGPTQPDPSPPREQPPATIRRFDASVVTRLNRNQWGHVHGQSINYDLSLDLASVIARSQYEYANNPFYHGIVSTYAMHVVGRNGPTLQVRSDNERFNEAVERRWRQVWKMPDPAGRLSGPDGLSVLVKQVLVAGSSLVVFKRVKRDGPVKFGWQTLHPRRLTSPPERAGDPLVQQGIEFDQDGRRVAYYFDNPIGPPGASSIPRVGEPKRVPADVVQHVFFDEEGEQVTGYPKLATALETAADMRQYEREVLAAARNAANHAIGLEAIDPTAVIDPDVLPMGACMPIEPGMVNAPPHGHKLVSLSSPQPMAQHHQYRLDRLAEIGRPLHMPLLFVLLSSSEGNFSQAQLDSQIYGEGIAAFNAMLERQHLDGCLEQVATEVVLHGEADRPDEYTAEWAWPKPPLANLEKMVKALRMAYEDGAISIIEYCERLGYEWERVQTNRALAAELFAELGLPPAPANAGTFPVAEAADEGEDEGDEATNQQEGRHAIA